MTLAPESIPFRSIGKLLLSLNLIGIGVIWLIGIYAYVTLEGLVPTSFNIEGEPREYTSSDIFLIVLPITSLAPIIVVLITIYRYSLLNKYPYLINLPAFYVYIFKIPIEKRSYWINRYFEIILAIGAILSLFMGLLIWGIYLGSVESKIPDWFLPSTISLIPLIIGPLIYSFYKLSKQMQKAISTE
jgi:hypothetical protein